ncbi:MAG: DNA primase [Deltaproteobacteria bacterium]|nr:DNA primase [Deltaproteobacteria bacterium]
MSGRVADDKIGEVRDRTSLVEIVSRYTALKRTGRNHTGLCPFHSEKTPSFSVSEERGLFYCFGCQASGDVFKFVMLKENLTFPEALERLAGEVGVELPKRPADERREQGRERLLRVTAFAAKFFERSLWETAAGATAREYLVQRKIAEATARGFSLGYAPPDGLAHALEKAGAPLGDAEAIGLIGRSSRGGGWFDRFRHRLMFPITDLAGKVTAFGGRLLPPTEDQAKYLNSSDSPLFHKGRSVFGLAAARDAIHRRNRVVLVEGYIDVIALAQAGLGNVVAPLGTSLTADQVRLLKRFTDDFVVLFDADRAGLAAAARGFEVFATAGIFARAAFLPQGHDPDTFVHQAGLEALERLLERSSPLVDHYLRSLAAADAPLAERARGAQKVAELCARLDDPIFVGLLVRRAAEHLDLPEEQLKTRERTKRPPPDASTPAPHARAFSSHETLILELLLVRPELKHRLPDDAERLFASPEARALFERVRAADDSHPPSQLVGDLPREAAARVARAWLGEEEIYAAAEQTLDDCLARLAGRAREARLRALTREIRDAESRGDTAQLGTLLAEKQRLAASKPPTAEH